MKEDFDIQLVEFLKKCELPDFIDFATERSNLISAVLLKKEFDITTINLSYHVTLKKSGRQICFAYEPNEDLLIFKLAGLPLT